MHSACALPEVVHFCTDGSSGVIIVTGQQDTLRPDAEAAVHANQATQPGMGTRIQH